AYSKEETVESEWFANRTDLRADKRGVAGGHINSSIDRRRAELPESIGVRQQVIYRGQVAPASRGVQSLREHGFTGAVRSQRPDARRETDPARGFLFEQHLGKPEAAGYARVMRGIPDRDKDPALPQLRGDTEQDRAIRGTQELKVIEFRLAA